MKPERQIRATYADILSNADPATLRVIGDLDSLYTSAPSPATPPFSTLLATRARAAARSDAGDETETVAGSVAGGGYSRSRRGWVRQGFAFAGAVLAFALVAAILVLLFRGDDGSNTSGAQPDPSPTTTVESALPANTPSQQITSGPHPDQIAFASIQDGNPEIYLINADGSGLTRLTNDPAADREPAWSPDGRRIAFASDRDGEQHLYVMNADGSDQRRVTDTATSVAAPVWSPDGEWIAFVAFSEAGFLDIIIVHPDGSDQRQLTDWQGIDTDPAWSPTSQQIVYRSDSGPGAMDDIFIVNIDGSGRANLTNDVIPQREPQWSRDGARIAFSHSSRQVSMGQGGTGNFDTIGIYNTTMQGGDPFQETDILGSAPRWSPDGHDIAYNRPASEPGTSNSSAQTMHILNADTLETIQISGLEGAMPIYDWSPDGTALAITMTNITADGTPDDERTLWLARIDGSAPVELAERLDTWARPAWRPDPSRTPEPSKTPPDLAIPTATPDISQPSEPVTPNALDSLAPLQSGQERHFVFDIRADYRSDESSFLNWNVKGSERMLPDGTLQQYMIVRDADNTVLIEYVNDGGRWWWNQRGWIEAGTTASGIVELSEELRIAMQEPRTAYRALMTDEYELIDERIENDTRIARYQFEDLGWVGQQLGITVESAYYEVSTTGDPAQVKRTRIVLVTPDDQEYALSDITFTEVVLIPAQDGAGNYVVPEAPPEDTFQYPMPETLPTVLTLERHWREDTGGLERMTVAAGAGMRVQVAIFPSRGGHDPRPMENLANRDGGRTVSTDTMYTLDGVVIGSGITWLTLDVNDWPNVAIWDDGHFRFELYVAAKDPTKGSTDGLLALIGALSSDIDTQE